MRLRDLRNGDRPDATRDEARNFTLAKRWVVQHWRDDELQQLTRAIVDGVNAECVARDQREHAIPISGKLYDDTPEVDPVTGKEVKPPIKIEERRKGLKHGHREVRLEARRRMYELILRRPDPATFFALFNAIGDDDGKDENGQWLCQRGVACEDKNDPAYPDGGGFDDRWPKWMPKQKRAAMDEPRPLQPKVSHSDKPGCPGCGGSPVGRGFRHRDGCPEKPANRKKLEAAIPAGV